MRARYREIHEQRKADIDAEAKALERRAQQRLRDVEHFHTERLCDRYRHLVPPERIHRVKDLSTCFEERRDFEESYREAGGAKPAEGTRVVGFSRDTLESAHVDMDEPQVRKNTIHERIHQLSDPRAKKLLGEKFYEGVTEDIAIKELGEEPNPDLPRSYPRERAMARKARELCGERAIERAYFQGDDSELRSCLERRLGKESLGKMEQAVENSSSLERGSEDLGD
jgi:hypothetical protein